MKTFDFSKTSFNAGLFIKEMQKKNIKVKYAGDTEVLIAKYKNHKEILFDIHSSLLTFPQGIIINDKFYTKKWLQKNYFSVTDGNFFRLDNIESAIKYAKKIKFPVVLKPTIGSHGDNVYTNIQSVKELKEKLIIFSEKQKNGFFIIESFFPGKEFRLFITKNGFFAAVERIPANITGDGKTNILLLIQRENARRMNPRNNCLCEIRLDDITFDFMEKNQISLDYVPKKGEKVFVRENSNVSTGGNCYDVTDQVHPTFINLAKEILSSFENLPFIGIDLITKDIKKTINKNNYIICELNSAPGLSLHMMPEVGKARNVAKELVNLLFPETI
jgi:cyanophycin synthetase